MCKKLYWFSVCTDKKRENTLRRFWRLVSREETETVTVVMRMNVEGRGEEDRKKGGWIRLGTILRTVGLCVNGIVTSDQRSRTMVADSK